MLFPFPDLVGIEEQLEVEYVVWDLGGVVHPDDITLSMHLGLGNKFRLATDMKEQFQDYLEGKLSTETFVTAAREKINAQFDKNFSYQEVYEALKANWEAPDPSVVAVMKALHEQGVEQYILSDCAPIWHETILNEYRHYYANQQYLQYVPLKNRFYSHEHHASKLRGNAYARFAEVMGRDVRKGLFIDNNLSNLDASGFGSTRWYVNKKTWKTAPPNHQTYMKTELTHLPVAA